MIDLIFKISFLSCRTKEKDERSEGNGKNGKRKEKHNAVAERGVV